jgi:uncharacterized delta-60 repeat protein
MNFRKIGIICNLITLLFAAGELSAFPQEYLYLGSAVSGSNAGTLYGAFTATNSTATAIPLDLPLNGIDYKDPNSMAITASGQYGYLIANDNTLVFQTVLYYNLTNNFLENTISTSINRYIANASMGRVALTPDGKYLLVTMEQQLSVINTATNTEVAHIDLPGLQKSAGSTPSYVIAISPIYSTSYTVFINIAQDNYPVNNTRVLPLTINVATGIPTPGTAFPVGLNSNGGIAITPDGSTLYVVNIPAGLQAFLYPVNTSTFAVGTPISIPLTNSQQTPSTVAIHPNGNTAYVITGSTGTAGNVNVINLNTQSFTMTVAGAGGVINSSTIPSCPFSADGSYLYVPGFRAAGNIATIQVINTATNTLAAQMSQFIGIAGGLNFAAIRPAVGGTLDTTFGNQGYTLTPLSRADTVQDLAIQSNDEILITGTTQTTAPSLYLARYTANGILDGSFNAGSTPGYYMLPPTSLIPTASACAGNAVNLDANQNILVAGYAAQSPTTLLLARFTTTGTLDTTFNSGGALPGVVTQSVGTGEGVTAAAVGVQSATYSNRIIVAGTSINNGIPSFTLAAFNATTGALDTTFGGTGTGYRIDTFGNVSILKAMVIPGSTAVYADNIFVTGIVDNQMAIAWYDPTGNLLQFYSPIADIANPGTGAGPTITSSSAYDIAYIDANSQGSTSPELYVAGSAITQGSTTLQSLIVDLTISPLIINVNFNSPNNGNGGFILSSLIPTTNLAVLPQLGAGSEFYSVTVQPNTNIVAGGYAIGGLANQLSLVDLAGFEMGGNEGETGLIASIPYGKPNLYWNLGTRSSLTTIGTLTAAQKIRCQSTGNVITAGTADGTYCIARFNGDSTTTP